METFEALKNHYDNYDEDSRLLSPMGQVEFLTTMRYIERYLKPGMRILEIGAGTGRYSHYLAQKGYRVDAVELIEHNIDVFRQHTQPGEPVTVTQGNALDLKGFGDETYDMTLLLGPMYHLFTTAEQKQAMAEAIRVTRCGGLVYAAYCNNDATVLQFCFGKGMLAAPRYQAMVDPETFVCTSTPEELFQLYRKEDVDALMEGFDTQRLHYVGTDMMAGFIKDKLAVMEETLFAQYMKYHFLICEREDMVGMTNHMLDVFRKK